MKIIKQGFTLIELLVVIAVIALLSSVVLASLSSARTKARDIRRIEDLNQIKLALEYYYDANGKYPPANNNPYNGAAFISSTLGGWPSLASYLSPYIKPLPKDPISNNGLGPLSGENYNYYYGCVGDGTASSTNVTGLMGYSILARLETPGHSQSCANNTYTYCYRINPCPSTGASAKGYVVSVYF